MNRTQILLAAATLLATSLAHAAEFHPNSMKYKDSSRPNATGRSGDAVVEATALLGSDLGTDIELVANGTIEKVQLKLDGQHAENFHPVGDASTFTHRIDGLDRNEAMQFQINVRGADPSRTGVVTLTESVRLRPDLRVLSLDAPANGVVNAPLQIAAVINERNGDTGARANCVLSADGIELDRANGIWVDANGTVSCRFSAVFDAAGTKQLRVAIEGVVPGDYDLANNAATATVEIKEPAQAFDSWNVSIRDYQTLYHRTFDSPTMHTEVKTEGWEQSVIFSGYIARLIDIESIAVSYSETSDGAPFFTAQPQFDFSPYFAPYRCGYSESSGVIVEACNAVPWWTPSCTVTVSRTAGDATYRSSGWTKTFIDGQEFVWSYSTEEGGSHGLQKRMGNVHALQVTLSDSSTTWEASPSVNLEPYGWQDSSRKCSNGPNGRSCVNEIESESGKSGFSSSN